MLLAQTYQLTREIAEGGFGRVYEAIHIHQPGTKYAIKFIKPEMFSVHGIKQRFLREVKVTSMLSASSEHIVKVYDDVGEFAHFGHYYVMEYLEGQTVKERLVANGGRLPMSESIGIFLQLCDAMKVAHDAGVVHRDLKPDNLCLVQSEDRPTHLKVLDFGIAKPLAWTTESITDGTVGTPLYMSPEQCLGKKVGIASDIYAMGVILFEFLTGTTPAAPQDPDSPATPMQIIYAHLERPTPKLDSFLPTGSFPPGLQEVLERALKKNPEERYPSVKLFEKAFREVVQGMASSSTGQATLVSPVQMGDHHKDEWLAKAPTLHSSAEDATTPFEALSSTSGNNTGRPMLWYYASGGLLLLFVGVMAGSWLGKQNRRVKRTKTTHRTQQTRRPVSTQTKAPVRTPAYVRKLKECPTTPYHWTFLRIKKKALRATVKPRLVKGKQPNLQPGAGIWKAVGDGYCVGIKTPSSRVLFEGKGILPCTLHTWSMPKRNDLFLVQEGDMEPEGEDYCRKGAQ